MKRSRCGRIFAAAICFASVSLSLSLSLSVVLSLYLSLSQDDMYSCVAIDFGDTRDAPFCGEKKVVASLLLLHKV